MNSNDISVLQPVWKVMRLCIQEKDFSKHFVILSMQITHFLVWHYTSNVLNLALYLLVELDVQVLYVVSAQIIC